MNHDGMLLIAPARYWSTLAYRYDRVSLPGAFPGSTFCRKHPFQEAPFAGGTFPRGAYAGPSQAHAFHSGLNRVATTSA